MGTIYNQMKVTLLWVHIMKRHKTRYSRKFNISNNIVDIVLFSQCVTSNPQERSYRKKQCEVVLAKDIDKTNTEHIKLGFINMRAAAVFILNNIDRSTMTINVFGNKYNANLVIDSNYKLYCIESIIFNDTNKVWSI